MELLNVGHFCLKVAENNALMITNAASDSPLLSTQLDLQCAVTMVISTTY